MKWPFVARKKYEKSLREIDKLNWVVEDYQVDFERMEKELEACWKCINARSNKGHWEKQKRVKGRFAK